ncbi:MULTISPECIES: mammalian cell entry protein [unclassified Mycobacterium]|uniref:mammalian cell entry protein n=1 Tax=unclassified Mycobacterium TaxID=2642494 RepID=UPI0029C8D43D|nr:MULTISPECIES: mammalian cell entry protein [unclassified Mycobacterium]
MTTVAARATAVGRRTRRPQSGPVPSGKRGRRRRALCAERDFVDDADTAEATYGDHDEPVSESSKDVRAIDDCSASADGRRRFSRWHTALAGAAAVVFVGAVAFAGAAVHTSLGDRATAAARTDVARTAVNAVTTLWTYTPETVDTLADRASQYLSGDFSVQYRKFLDAAAAPNKQAQVSDTTEVVGVGVESLSGPDAVAIVLTNTTATSPLTKNIPSLKYVGYRLAMKHEGSRWLVTKMSTVSFTDLTPQL